MPSAVDPGRVGERLEPRPHEASRFSFGDARQTLFMAVPEGAEKITATFPDFDIQGSTVFPREELEKIYAPFRGRAVTLDTLWVIAGQITEKYRGEGFFLSRAFVPQQELGRGDVARIVVVEGAVDDISFETQAPSMARLSAHPVVRRMVSDVLARKPVRAADIESFLLRLNDIAGVSLRGVLRRAEGADLDAVVLSLVEGEPEQPLFVELNNFGSRFLGPYQVVASYTAGLVPLHSTTVTVANTLPVQELSYVSVRHAVPVAPAWQAVFGGGYVATQPGENLKAFDLTGETIDFYAEIEYRPIRLRNENLRIFGRLAFSQTDTDILSSTLVKDRIRKLEAGISYDHADRFSGYNIWQVALAQGVNAFGARSKGQPDISRAQAEADFTKLTLAYARQQSLPGRLSLFVQSEGQVASGPLFSSEEFGFGGQRFGRAYDGSEIVGDHGVAFSAELRYHGLDVVARTRTNPYVFYDIGSVWNEDAGQVHQISAASAGFGLRFQHESGLFANMGAAFPLTKEATTPIYKGSGDQARFLLQVSSRF